MQGHDELILIAELGVAFAGFLAIFLIFARQEGRFSPADSLRVRSIIAASFVALFGALVPLLLALFTASEAFVWRASSALGLAVGLATSSHIAWMQWQMPSAERAAVGFIHSNVAWTLDAVAALVWFVNVLGLWGGPCAGFHVAGLMAALGVATSNFVAIAHSRLL